MIKSKRLKRTLAAVICGIMVVASLAGCGKSKGLSGKSADEIVKMMGFGINIGNTFDSTGGDIKDVKTFERSWGNPLVTKEWIQGCKDAGLNTVRIPITWYRAFSDKEKFTILPEYLARVKEVVDWCYECDMFVIINMHHENWLNNENLVNKTNAVKTEFICIWEQLADYFGDYDQHLIFEAMNEPRLVYSDGKEDWNGNKNAYEAVNELNQVFVDTVRRSKKAGNADRCLMIPGYAASSNPNILKTITIPQTNGEDAKNIIISVHSYTPYNFCLTDAQDTFGAGDKSQIDGVFKSLKTLFLSKGIPVVMGETSATNTNDNTEARAAWAEHTAKTAAAMGVPIVLWDNGSDKKSGGECHAWINRRTNVPCYPTVMDALMKGKSSVEWGSTK